MIVNSWQKVDSFGEPSVSRNKHAAAVYQSKLFVVGGYSLQRREFLNDVLAFDFSTKVWETLLCSGTPPSKRRAHSCIVAGHFLVVFGGYNGEQCLNDTFTLDLHTLEWKARPCMGQVPPRRGGHTAVLWQGDKMVIHGGWDVGSLYFDTTYFLHMGIDRDGNDSEVPWRWEALPTRAAEPPQLGITPIGRVGHAAVLYQERFMVIFGGYGVDGYHGDLVQLDLSTSSWSSVESFGVKKPGPRTFCTMERSGSRILVFGGSNHDVEMNDVFVMDLHTRRWEEVRCAGRAPEGRFAHVSAVYHGRVYVYGGIVRSARELCGLFELTSESFAADPSLASLATRWLAQGLLRPPPPPPPSPPSATAPPTSVLPPSPRSSPISPSSHSQSGACSSEEVERAAGALSAAAGLPSSVASELTSCCHRLLEMLKWQSAFVSSGESGGGKPTPGEGDSPEAGPVPSIQEPYDAVADAVFPDLVADIDADTEEMESVSQMSQLDEDDLSAMAEAGLLPTADSTPTPSSSAPASPLPPALPPSGATAWPAFPSPSLLPSLSPPTGLMLPPAEEMLFYSDDEEVPEGCDDEPGEAFGGSDE